MFCLICGRTLKDGEECTRCLEDVLPDDTSAICFGCGAEFDIIDIDYCDICALEIRAEFASIM